MIPREASSRGWGGFTLIELMVVCGIIALVMATAVPSIYRQLHPESLQKAVNDIMEKCNEARALAILNGSASELVLNTVDRTISVGAASSARSADRLDSPDVAGNDWRMQDRSHSSKSGAHGGGAGVKISDRIQLEGIRLNFLDYTEDEIVRVRFYPNGTSDEFSLFLLSDKGERRQIFLEVVTALADFEIDPKKFR